MESEVFLPLDFQLQILTWLPAIVVLRFRVVCKAWNVVTRSTFFIEQHMARSLESQADPFRPTNFLFVPRSMNDNNTTVMTSLELEKEKHRKRLAAFPSDHHFMSSCNGLLLLQCHDNRHTCIFNPTTNETFEIPPPFDYDDSVKVWSMGFGYDSINKEYKVVVFVYRLIHMVYFFMVCTITPRGDIFPWRSIHEETRSHLPKMSIFPKLRQVLLYGKLHFLARERRPNSTTKQLFPIVLSFDLHKEKLDILSMAKVEPRPWGTTKFNLVLTELEGCLSVISKSNTSVKVWTMTEYPKCTSWTLMFEFYTKLRSFHQTVFKHDVIYCFPKDGKLYICCGNVILSCDPTTGYCVKVGSNLHLPVVGFPSVTTLISLRAVVSQDPTFSTLQISKR